MKDNINENISFRLGVKTIESLKKISLKEQESVNAIVNRVLTRFAKWDSQAYAAGMIQFPRSVLARLFEKCSDNEIENIAKEYVKTDFRDQILLMKKDFSSKDIIDSLEYWSKVSHFPYTHDDIDNVCTMVIRHQLGNKFSLFLKHVLTGLFTELNLDDMYFEITNKTLYFRVKGISRV